MKRLFGLMLSLLAVSSVAFAQQTEEEPVPAFPGAEGFGRYTNGGRGGKVYHVTTLEDTDNEGSLRYACIQRGARTIVFDVCGTIFLNKPLIVNKDSCTIAGQTAPGDGICIAEYPVKIQADNVIVRFVRFRLGSRRASRHEGDAIGAMDHHNIILDHCSMSWSVDECCSVYGGKNLTVQWCIVSQSLVNGGHSKGAHGYAGNWGGAGATYAHNLIVHHASRTPRFGPRPKTQGSERVDFRNNVLYNWSGEGCYGGEAMNVNIVNNYYKPGPAAVKNSGRRIFKPGIRTTKYCDITEFYADGTPANGNGWIPTWHRWGHFFVEGNVNSKYPEVTADNWKEGVEKFINRKGNDGLATDVTMDTIRLRKPLETPYTTSWSAEESYEKVLKYAGCCRFTNNAIRWDRLDSIMIADVLNDTVSFTGTGLGDGLINTQEDVRCALLPNAWPDLKANAWQLKVAREDADNDGIPDFYEKQWFKKDVDPNAKCTKKGYTQYTNMDYYLARLAEKVTAGVSPEYVKMDK